MAAITAADKAAYLRAAEACLGQAAAGDEDDEAEAAGQAESETLYRVVTADFLQAVDHALFVSCGHGIEQFLWPAALVKQGVGTCSRSWTI